MGSPESTEPLSPISPEKSKAVRDTRAYAKEHNLTLIVQEMLQNVLRERPDTPYSVMAEYFKRKSEDMGEKPQEPIADAKPKADTAANSLDGDLERLQLEAEHLALHAERASLLRELESMS